MIIAEDVLLLAYDDESGAADPWAANLDYRLAGALLVELAQLGRIELSHADDPSGARAGRVVVRDAASAGHPELDAALETIAEKPRKPADLVEPPSRGLTNRLLDGLAARGVLRVETGRVLGIIPVTRWPAEDSTHETALRSRLRDVLLERATPDARDAALLAVLRGSGLERGLVPKERRTEAADRLEQLAQSGWATEAASTAIDEMTAVIVAAVIVPSIVTTTIAR